MMCSKYFVLFYKISFSFHDSRNLKIIDEIFILIFLYDYTIVIKRKDIIYKLCCSYYRFKIQTYVCFET